MHALCLVKEYSRLMKKVDPTIELVAVGWERSEWNYRLVKEAGEYFDYLALNSYHPEPATFATAMALPKVFWEQLDEMLGAVDSASYYIKERRGPPIRVAVDEWNMREWDHLRFIEWLSLAYGFNPRNRELEARRSDLVREPAPSSPENMKELMRRSIERDQEDGGVHPAHERWPSP